MGELLSWINSTTEYDDGKTLQHPKHFEGLAVLHNQQQGLPVRPDEFSWLAETLDQPCPVRDGGNITTLAPNAASLDGLQSCVGGSINQPAKSGSHLHAQPAKNNDTTVIPAPREDNESDDGSSVASHIFSPSSTASSVSSVSDADSDSSSVQSQPSNYPSGHLSIRRTQVHNQSISRRSSQQCINAGVKPVCTMNHPRRRPASASWSQPTLIRQHQRRQQLVEKLVDSATELVALIWPEPGATKASPNRIISLRFFIRETLRRSRTSYSTLQVTLWYLVLIRPFVSPSLYPEADNKSDSTFPGQEEEKGSFRALRCGRRMFLAALILASKFLQDRNFTARAWSKITGLPAQEIIFNEFKFLAAIGWNLHLKEHDFMQWNSIILRCSESAQLGKRFKETWTHILDLISGGSKLDHIASVLNFQMSWSAFTTSPTATLSPANVEDMTRSSAAPPVDTTSFIQGDFTTFGVDNVPRSMVQELITPQPPALGGTLETPQLPPFPTSSNVTTPAAGSDVIGSGLSTVQKPMAISTQKGLGDWQKLRSEFPMDFVQTPETTGGPDSPTSRDHVGDALQNRAFGVVTPSSTMDHRPAVPIPVLENGSNFVEEQPCASSAKPTRISSTTADHGLQMLALAANVTEDGAHNASSLPSASTTPRITASHINRSAPLKPKVPWPVARKASAISNQSACAALAQCNDRMLPEVLPDAIGAQPTSDWHRCRRHMSSTKRMRSLCPQIPDENQNQSSGIGSKRSATPSSDCRPPKSRCVSPSTISIETLPELVEVC